MFTEKFIECLQNDNLTAYAVAKATGISQGTMAEYRSGKIRASYSPFAGFSSFQV